ncbi:MAG: hypothetical protein JWP85_1951 [Rhodoglobus sp.]|nr:hypothetical protein [Rhodoglobus sp.]
MPDVVGLQLDIVKSDIERAGFGGDVEIIGGGLFSVVNESTWDFPRLMLARSSTLLRALGASASNP